MKVVNIKFEKCTHFCGRKEYYKNNGIDYSILGNPYTVGEYGRGKAIPMFRKLLNKSRLENGDLWQAVINLPEDAVLGCFCKPKDCHCDVIIDAYNWYNSDDNKRTN